MNKIITSIFIFYSAFAFSQMIIGTGKSNVTNSSVSLEFGTANKGMILPYVTSAASVAGAVDGTIIMDAADGKIKYRKSGSWFNLSNQATSLSGTELTTLTAIQSSKTELSTAKVSIGTPTAVPGILVLEDADKAMILPSLVSPHLNILNPAPGMMAYDITKKQLAVYNGSQWSFWKLTP